MSAEKKFQEFAEVVRISGKDSDKSPIHELVLRCPQIASLALPGQFVTLGPADDAGSVLRRPFSIYMADGRNIKVVFEARGPNTDRYARLSRGERISVLGPIGRPAAFDQAIELLLLVSGGCGLASLHYYTTWWIEQNPRVKAVLSAGFRSPEYCFGLPDFADLGVETECIFDAEGTAVDLFQDMLSRESNLPDSGKIRVITCGPEKMMRSVAGLCQQNDIPCQVFLERMIACGTGDCKGCAVKTTDPKNPVKHLCEDGPMFDAMEVRWNG